MKRIITTAFLFMIVAFAGSLSAQQVSKEQRVALQSDNVETFKKAFSKSEYDKCMSVKDFSTTMLMYSIKYDRKNITNFLIANKSDVNKACEGKTPLMISAQYGFTSTAKMLISKGANRNAKDNDGKTAKDYAVEFKHTETASAL